MHRNGTRKKSRGSNFYTEINDGWMEDTTLPNTESRITQAFFIQRDINKELNAIIENEGGSMADLVRSWKTSEGKIPDGVTTLTQIMMTMASPSDIASRIGWMNRYGLPAPLLIYAQGDPRDHTRCRIFIEEGQPRIGIPEYWIWPEYTAHRKAYATYVRSLSATLGLPAALLGYAAEREFARVFPSILERKVRINMLTWHELCKEYTTIDWYALFTSWGLDATQLPGLVFNVSSHAFLHHIQTRMERWSIERWQGWFALIAAQWISGLSPHGPLRSAWFNYARRFLQGSMKDEGPHELRNSIVRAMMPNSLGQLWVKKHCNPKLKTDITTMIKHIHDAAAAQLKKTEWMAEKTRLAAIRKLRAMDVQVCWPDFDKWRLTKPACGLTNNLVDNLLAIGKLSSDANQKMLKDGDCRHPFGESWGKAVFEVNAYYYPDENRFLLPAAILRPPFYDARKSLATNYGAIGATIGHELCHAFDADGRQYDANGDMRDWWSPRDDREYHKKAQQVVRLYESRQYRGLNVDGSLTLVENIADIGGLGFALGGLRLALGREPTRAEMREFFTSFAVSWRSKDRYKRATELLDTNVHAPPYLRVNHAVRQMDEWYAAFDVGMGHSEWIPPERRIRFFG